MIAGSRPPFFGYTNSTVSQSGRGRRRTDPWVHRKQLDEYDVNDVVEGIVRGVNSTGIWVDVGAIKDALLPHSQVNNAPPLPGDKLDDLRVTGVDHEKNRITLELLKSANSGGIYFYIGGSGRDADERGEGLKALEDMKVGQHVTGVVRKAIQSTGVFVDVGAYTDGLLHWEHVPSNLDVKTGAVLDNLYVIRLDLQRSRLWLGVLSDFGKAGPIHKGKGKGKTKGKTKGKAPRRNGRPLEDFMVGQEVSGVVRQNVLDAGVFIDIGAVVDARLSHDEARASSVFQPFQKGSIVKGLYITEVFPRLSVGILGQERRRSGRQGWEPADDSEASYRGRGAARAQSSDRARDYSYDAWQGGQGGYGSDRGSAGRQYGRAMRAMRSQSPFGYRGGYDQEEYYEEVGAPYTFSGKGGSTAYPSSASSYANPSGTEAEDYEDNIGFPSDSDLPPHEVEPEQKRPWRANLPLPGKSRMNLPPPRAEAAEDGLFSSMVPGIRDWLSRIQEPELQEPDQVPLVAEDARTDVGDEEGIIDDEDVVEELKSLTLGAVVDGTVTRVTEGGARVDFGCAVEGILPQRLIDWPVRVGDEVVDLVISRVDLERQRVTLAVEHSEVDEEKVGAFTPSSRATVAKGAGRGSAGGRGRGGGRGQGRGAGGRDSEREDAGGDRLSEEGEAQLVEGEVQEAEVERQVAPLLFKIFSGQRSAARELAKAVAASRQSIQACFNASGALKVLMRFNNCAAAALLGIQELSEKLGRESEPLLARIIPEVLQKYGDRQRSVQVAAEDAAETIIARLNPYGVEAVLPAVLKVLQRREKTDIKVGALRLLALMRDEDTIRPLARKLDEIIPCVVDMLNDVKKEVRAAAKETAKVLFECAENRDLDGYLGDIIEALMSQERIPACVNQLSEIVFVQPVETQALAVMMPLVQRGLKDRDAKTKRKALVIADNMCKLVNDVSEIHPFLSTLIPLVKKAKEHISDREVLGVADRCWQTLDAANRAGRKKVIGKSAVHEILNQRIPEEKQGVVTELMADYVADLCRTMSACRTFDYAEWWQCISPYLTPHILSQAECDELVLDLLENCYDAAEGDDVEDDDEEGDDLCNCVFSLGYGALTLLNNTRLHLKRGECYGLCGPNDSGKSTLLRAINNEQVDGFPPKTELVTAFVEHGIGEKEPECEWTPLEYMFADETIQAMQISKKKVVAALRSLGFDNHKLKSEIGHLSGGWKMKLGLVRAMLMCADILLLDEPTGHLDSDNVAWLGDYILGVKNDSSRPVTTIVVSHNTAFLDKVCSHIISVKQRKLKTYRGNITEFVKRQPDAQAYFTLANEKSKFVLPDPGALEGVRSRGKVLLRMHNVTYTYPNNETPTLTNVSIEVSMLSRVAVMGPNGSGKSTLVRALVGELPLNHRGGRSSVWKHPNTRISYVAQHAFHHIEQHLDKTATQYMLWRFAGGEDREALGYKAEEVGRERRPYFFDDGVLTRITDGKDRSKAVEPEQILGRRRAKHLAGTEDQFEYQTKWRNMPVESATWVSRERLVDMGAVLMVQREDEKQAVVSGILARQLTTPQIEEHLLGFGLEANFASHMRLGVLSAGQKVKVVLGAATWHSPHILILDEPTNYLDRESLGGLASALKEFKGGVIVVSHSREFCHTVCDERWVMDTGRLSREGQIEKEDVRIDRSELAQSFFDESGNLHERPRSLGSSSRDLKRHRRQKALRKKRGEEVSSDEDLVS